MFQLEEDIEVITPHLDCSGDAMAITKFINMLYRAYQSGEIVGIGHELGNTLDPRDLHRALEYLESTGRWFVVAFTFDNRLDYRQSGQDIYDILLSSSPINISATGIYNNPRPVFISTLPEYGKTADKKGIYCFDGSRASEMEGYDFSAMLRDCGILRAYSFNSEWRVLSYNVANSLDSLLAEVDSIAKAEFDGHYTLLSFTTGYRVGFRTLDTDSGMYGEWTRVPQFKSLELALRYAIKYKPVMTDY